MAKIEVRRSSLFSSLRNDEICPFALYKHRYFFLLYFKPVKVSMYWMTYLSRESQMTKGLEKSCSLRIYLSVTRFCSTRVNSGHSFVRSFAKSFSWFVRKMPIIEFSFGISKAKCKFLQAQNLIFSGSKFQDWSHCSTYFCLRNSLFDFDPVFMRNTVPELWHSELHNWWPQNWKVDFIQYWCAESEYVEKLMQKSAKFFDNWEKPVSTSCSEKFY